VKWDTLSSGTTQALNAAYVFPARNTVVVGNGGLVLDNPLESGDNTWVLRASTTTRNLRALFFNLAGFSIAVGDSGKVVRTTDHGTSWTTILTGTANNLRAIFFTNVSNGYATGTIGTMLRTTDGGLSWALQITGQATNLNSTAWINSSSGVAVGNIGVMLQTTDGGTTWTSRTSGTTQALNGIAFATRSTGLIMGNSGTLLRTTNGGLTWTLLAPGTTQTLRSATFLDSLLAIVVGNIVLRTTDGGSSWTTVSSSGLFGIAFATPTTGIFVGPSLAPGLPPVMLRTTDAGVSWTALSVVGQVPPCDLRSIVFVNSTQGYACGTTGIIVETRDAGQNWQRMSSPSNATLTGLSFPGTSLGFAVGTGGTILRFGPAPTTGAQEHSVAVGIHDFSLSQDYPNPFNPTTQISFALSVSSFLTLEIYNILGQHVTTLLSEPMSAGAHTVPWDARENAFGVYIYRLTAIPLGSSAGSPFNESKRLLLLR
jgi:photosystem II stability/assembly factor-like uncharacterized protein